MRSILIAAIFFVSSGWSAEPRWIIGSANPDIFAGARALMSDRNEEGIKLTLAGLQVANGKKEE